MEQEILNYNIGIRRDINNLFSYSYFEKLNIGQLVIVNFRNKDDIGVVIDSKLVEFNGAIKNISAILPYSLNKEYLKFARFVSNYNLVNFGNILKLLVPFSINKILLPEKSIKIANIERESTNLSKEQQAAVDKMLPFQKIFKTILLHGITGSGKTEVFLKFASRILQPGDQILIMIPEIALANELAVKVTSRLGIECYIWHNSVSVSQKLSIWKKAVNGEQICIVGARSSLFIPFRNLSCIIIDEEHDHSYKQSETIIYNARDMAIYLGFCLNIPVVLSSATPSLESYHNAMTGKYEYIKLESRYFENAALPNIYIDDIRKQDLVGTLTEYSIHEINKCLSSKKQALIFVNRRGHTPKVLCKACGWKIGCPNCTAWLCYHYNNNEFICHYCGYKTDVKTKCENCGENTLIGLGSGVEKVAIECFKLFPNAKILTLSSDIINTSNKILKAINLIKNHEVDLIIGTQIVSKGHNFPNLNLVIITCMDAMLYGDDFRSIERAFQTVYQVSGRAGRVDAKESKVIIQTYNPEDKLMNIIEKNDIESLYSIELSNRKLAKMPPFGRIASLTLSGMDEEELINCGKQLILAAPQRSYIKILGPTQPIVYKLKLKYRLKIHIISLQNIQNYIKTWISFIKTPSKITLLVDIDPYEF